MSPVLADVLDYPLKPGSYDAIMSMSTLHHLPLAPTLQHLVVALRPGGVLAAVALPRTDLPRELAVELVGSAWHLLVGAGLGASAHHWGAGLRRGPDHDLIPMRNPQLSVRQVRQQATDVLPGVDARHTAATLLLQQGVPARVVMEVLGHSHISLTLGTYSHVVPELAKEAAQRMGDALWS